MASLLESKYPSDAPSGVSAAESASAFERYASGGNGFPSWKAKKSLHDPISNGARQIAASEALSRVSLPWRSERYLIGTGFTLVPSFARGVNLTAAMISLSHGCDIGCGK